MKRERPQDGGMVWHEKFHAFECYGCGEFEEIRSARDRQPDNLAELKDLLIKEHTECWEFDDPQMARDARKYRKKKKQRELAGRNGAALDCSGYLRRRRV